MMSGDNTELNLDLNLASIFTRYRDRHKTEYALSEEFMALVLQHTLPKGFRRSRDYGFLHVNAKRILKIVQWALQIAVPIVKPIEHKKILYQKCRSPMRFTGFIPACAKLKLG